MVTGYCFALQEQSKTVLGYPERWESSSAKVKKCPARVCRKAIVTMLRQYPDFTVLACKREVDQTTPENTMQSPNISKGLRGLWGLHGSAIYEIPGH